MLNTLMYWTINTGLLTRYATSALLDAEVLKLSSVFALGAVISVCGGYFLTSA